MAIDAVRTYFAKFGREDDIMEVQESSATVDLAAYVLGVESGRIAKSISLKTAQSAMLIITSGDVLLDNRKFKDAFHMKPRMCSAEEVLEFTGHAVGGVCPFALKMTLDVYLDESLKRFGTVFPACGSSNSMIELTLPDLEKFSLSKGYVNVCKYKSTD